MDEKLTKIISFSLESLDEALEVAKKSVPEDAAIELASPLIKSAGSKSIEAFRKAFPENTIIADYKTMDTGAFEVGIAKTAGADMITVSSLTSTSTIKGAVDEANSQGMKIILDMIVDDLPRAKECESLGVHYIRLNEKGLVDRFAKDLSVPILATSRMITISESVTCPPKRADIREDKDSYPALQVALDLNDLEKAASIAEKAKEARAQWLEVGTPLVKFAGMDAVRTLRKNHPDSTIVADLKTLKDSGTEVMIAARAGADIIGICGIASDSVIKDAVSAADKCGVKIMADLISVEDHVARAIELEALGVDYLEFHVSVDEQMANKQIPFGTVKDVAESVSIPVCVAGGMKPETAPKAVDAGARVAVVGGYITKSADPKKAAQDILSALK